MKALSAKKCLEMVKPNSVIGVGSGSTVAYFIDALASAVKQGFEVKGLVSTSDDTTLRCKEVGLDHYLLPLECVSTIDVAVDGADAVFSTYIVKGGGGALLREKIVAYMAKQFFVLVDETKVERKDWRSRVPVEVFYPAWSSVERYCKRCGWDIRMRKASDKLGPVISDNGNVLADVYCDTKDAAWVEKELNNVVGILENGIFTKPSKLIIGKKDGSVDVLDHPFEE